MRCIRFTLIGSVIALLTATAAQATVVYNWHSTSPGPYVTATGGELMITDAAYRSGSIDFYVNYPYTSPGVIYDHNGRITNSPVVSASLTFSLTDGGGWAPGVFAQPGSQYFASMGFPFLSTLTFYGDGLWGDLFLYDESDEVNISDSQVYNYGSDYFTSELCGPPTCDGGSGYWQLSSVTVPEPPVWPLFGLGILGLLSLLRLRRRE